jgi:4-hydroxy-tetrahydrodipicolinate reductase
MKIGIIGYGKMGKIVEQIALERGHTISFILKNNNCKINKDVDVAIDFSTPNSAFDNINKCLLNNIKIISGTTGWLNKIEQVHLKCRSLNGTFLHASNFSLGANIFFELNKNLSKLISNFNYNVSINEAHHIHKLDKPSGTAITLARDIELNCNNKFKDILIESVRENEVNGVHNIIYESFEDSISITHKAKNRKGFAKGAVITAEWIKDKQGIFTIKDMLKLG